jgi:hypothetical protein
MSLFLASLRHSSIPSSLNLPEASILHLRASVNMLSGITRDSAVFLGIYIYMGWTRVNIVEYSYTLGHRMSWSLVYSLTRSAFIIKRRERIVIKTISMPCLQYIFCLQLYVHCYMPWPKYTQTSSIHRTPNLSM